MARRNDWIIRLSAQDVAELEAALAYAKAARLGIPALGRDGFPLKHLAARLDQVRRELESGRGFVLIRGLPVQRYSKADSALIYWGIGTYLGPAFAQNAQGDLLGHVRDLGSTQKNNLRARGYQTRDALPFHNDSTDVVGLLCLAKAKSGGLSRIVSSTAVYNEMARRRPDLARVMEHDWCIDRRGENDPGQKPYFVTPFFIHFDGRMWVKYNRDYVESAQRFSEAPRLSATDREALDLMDAICNDPDFYLDMSFEPGDMQFLCNYVVLHSRTDYEDWPEPQRKRHLLRLWLRTAAFAKLPPAFDDRNSDMLRWQRNPRPPVFDMSEIEFELEH